MKKITVKCKDENEVRKKATQKIKKGFELRYVYTINEQYHFCVSKGLKEKYIYYCEVKK